MQAFPITEEQVESYHDNGFLQLHDVLRPQDLEDIRRSLDEVMQKPLTLAFDRVGKNPEYDRVFSQKVNLWREHEGVRRFVFNERLAAIARRLSRSNAVRLWHDHALVKPGVMSKPTPWHQDLPYWPMQQAGALSCWMALDDVDETNGCIQFIPGSHKVGRLEPIRLADPQDIFALAPADAGLSAVRPFVAAMKAGSCTFHNGLTFHSASANTSGKARRAMIVIYMPDGTTFRDKPHICTDGLGFKEGRTDCGSSVSDSGGMFCGGSIISPSSSIQEVRMKGLAVQSVTSTVALIAISLTVLGAQKALRASAQTSQATSKPYRSVHISGKRYLLDRTKDELLWVPVEIWWKAPDKFREDTQDAKWIEDGDAIWHITNGSRARLNGPSSLQRRHRWSSTTGFMDSLEKQMATDALQPSSKMEYVGRLSDTRQAMHVIEYSSAWVDCRRRDVAWVDPTSQRVVRVELGSFRKGGTYELLEVLDKFEYDVEIPDSIFAN